ncbi:MAG: diguanylate cyclase domain-containing protein [Chloroflexota bacterium]
MPAEQLLGGPELVQKLRASEDRFRLLFHTVACGLIVHDANGKVVEVNEAAEEILGMRKDELAGRFFRHARREDGRKVEHPALVALRTGQPVRQFTMMLRRREGPTRWLQVDHVPVLGPDGRTIQVIASFVDVTQRKREQEEVDVLEHQALHDPLTDLPNRTLLYDRLRQAILGARRSSSSLALLMLDLDHFKEVNDTLGHAAGDELLRQLGARLAKILRQSDTVARLGGDEFAILLPSAATAQHAGLTAIRLLDLIRTPFEIEDRAVVVGASIGIAIHPQHGEEAEPLLRAADRAMYEAKRQGSGYALYATAH